MAKSKKIKPKKEATQDKKIQESFPENSSPVCYANSSGWREGYEKESERAESESGVQ